MLKRIGYKRVHFLVLFFKLIRSLNCFKDPIRNYFPKMCQNRSNFFKIFRFRSKKIFFRAGKKLDTFFRILMSCSNRGRGFKTRRQLWLCTFFPDRNCPNTNGPLRQKIRFLPSHDKPLQKWKMKTPNLDLLLKWQCMDGMNT